MCLLKSLTVFLKELRLKNNDERLSDMSKRLGVSASYLSTIETQKRRMNDKLYDNIVSTYQLSEDEAKELNIIRSLISNELVLSMDEMDSEKKETIIKFLSSVEDLSKEDVEKINLLLKKK
jgi:transcriptional regulator with XRE-family HTH domain